jgi:CheY-like chemotaxis protein
MLDNEDLKWIAEAAIDLNAMLQQIARYSELAQQHKGEYNYVDLLAERAESASKSAQLIFDWVTGKILAGSGATIAAAFEGRAMGAAKRPFHSPGEFLAFPVSPTSDFGEHENGNGSAAAPVVQNPQGSRELLLLVEDDVEVAELSAQMLIDEGYKVIIADNGFEALKIYRTLRSEIGLVILDFFLPIIDGDAVFEELRAVDSAVNVVVSSGFGEQAKLSTMLRQGLRGFIPKPYTREKLLAQVRSILDSTPQPTT